MSQTIEPPTEAEAQALRDEYDTVLVASSQQGHRKKLHLPHKHDADQPVCQFSYNGVEPSEQSGEIFRTTEMACFPPGYYPFCRFCWDTVRGDI